MRLTVGHRSKNSSLSARRKLSVSTVVTVQGVLVPDHITTEFISYRAFHKNHQDETRETITEYTIDSDYIPILNTVSHITTHLFPFFKAVSKSQRRISRRYSTRLNNTLLESGVLPTFDFTVPLCCELLKDLNGLTYNSFVEAVNDHAKIKKNYNDLKINKFKAIVCEQLSPAERIVLSLLLLSLKSSHLFKMFQIKQFDKRKYSNEDVYALQTFALKSPPPVKQLLRKIIEICRIVDELTVIFSGFIVGEDECNTPNEIGYRMIRVIGQYETFVLKGTDGTGVYDFGWNKQKVALCLKVDVLSSMLFSREALKLGFIRFYMSTLSYFTEPIIVYQFIIDNKHLTDTPVKEVYKEVCIEFVDLWGHCITDEMVKELHVERKLFTLPNGFHNLACTFEEQLTVVMHESQRRLTLTEIIECKLHSMKNLSVLFSEYVIKKLKTKKKYVKMVKTALQYIKLNNFDCAHSIYCGLLSRSWMPSDKYIKKIKCLKDFDQLENLFSLDNNSINYRQTILDTKAPFIPVVAMIEQDLTILSDKPTFVDDTNNLIRVDDKLRPVYTTINMFLRGNKTPYDMCIISTEDVIEKLKK
ncbi:Ras-GEF domain-containing protein [Entamoeba marina]